MKRQKKQTMSDSYRQAVEEFRQWSENISAREKDFKNGLYATLSNEKLTC
jgi:hypothetical protein